MKKLLLVVLIATSLSCLGQTRFDESRADKSRYRVVMLTTGNDTIYHSEYKSYLVDRWQHQKNHISIKDAERYIDTRVAAYQRRLSRPKVVTKVVKTYDD